MSHLSPGLMPVYNSLSDKHLAGYFSNTRIRRHLQRAGLITRSGRIVPDKEYRHKLIQRAHQRHVRECLAQAIFHKVLEMEVGKRLHQIEIKRKLEESARRERVHRIKVECSKRYEEDIIRILSPRPPMGSRSNWKQHSGPEREHSESSESPSSSRPNTAPGKMQRPVRLEPIHSNSTTASFRRSSPYRIHESSQENQPLNSTMDKFRRNLTAKEVYHGVSPYCLPVINNFVTPVPPVAKKNDRGVKVIPSSTVRGRRLRPTTASSGAVVNPPWLRISVYQSRVRVNMVYFGKTVHLSNDLIDTRDDVRVFQQHCGGENLCVYKWKLREGDAFQFISRRHRGFPFSLTFYLNGLQVERLSSCCEFKHRKGSRLGGRHGHFGFSSVEGASPCYKCIIAMGLDKKPTPPPKRLKGDQSREQSATSLKDEPEMEAYRTREGAASHLERESCQAPKMETTIKEQPAHVETKVRDDYEEDFEADDEGPVEEATSQEKSPSLFSETEKKDQEPDAFEAEDEEDDDKRSYSGSSMSGSDEEETDSETTKHSEDYEKEDKAKENDQSEAAAHASDKHELKSVETAATGVKSASVNNSDLLHSAGDSTGIEISDTSIPTGNENKLSDDSPEDKNVEVLGHEIKNEDEQERAKSVQEKLAVAILKEFQCCSEPELSDTSTEEEEGPADNAPEKEKQEQLQTLAEVKSHEESVTNEVVEEQIEFKEPEEKKDTDLDNGENTQEQRTSEDGEHEKAAEDETRTEGDKSEEPAEEQLPVDGEKVAQDDKIEYSFEGSELADVDASHNDKEKVAKGAAEPDSQHNETGQIAKRREKDESSVLEPSEEANEAAVPDIAEAEAGATSETMETKAESLEEQEALSCEEAPETATEKIQTDSEEARIATEYSSRSLEECGDSTVEKTADMHLETQSSNHEILVGKKQQASGTEEGEDDSQQENCGVKEESVEVNETAEKQSQTNLERTEAENKAEEINDGNKVDESIEQNKNPPERTECEEIPDEESKNEIIENEKDAKGVRAESEISWGEAEAMVDDKSQAGEEGSETNKALREKDDEEGMSVNAEKHKVEEIKTNEECEGTTKNSVAEERETSEITEDPEKSQDADLYMQKVKMSSEKIADSENISESKEADGTKMHEPTHVVAEGKTGEREAETESEREIEAENGESSFAAEREPREDEENALTADKERQIDEPDDEIKSTDVEEVAVESGDNVKKQEDGLTDQALETGITESNAKEADGSMVKYDEAVNRDSEPETPGAEIQEWRKGNEKAKAVEDENKESNLIQNNVESDTDEVSHLGEISLTQTAADVEETANQEDEGKLESITDKPLETGENGEDTEEASKASEEGASVLLKPRAKNTEAEDVVGEGTPEDLARDDNTDMVTNWIQMHQTSRFFETFVEPLEDLRNEAPNAQVSTPNGEEKESANLLRPESPTKMERMSGNKETEESRDETQIKAQDSHGEVDQRENDPAEGELQGSEETDKKSLEVNKEPDQRDSRGSHGDDEVSQEGNTAFTTEVETFSDSLKAERDFENQSSGNVNSGPGLIVKQAATDLQFKPEQSNSQNEQKDTGNTWDNIGRDGRQITQITNFTTSHSADGSQKESHDEDVQTEMLEQQFSGETRDMQLIEDIKHTLSKEPLSTFSLFGHTSYPLLTTSGSDGGQ